MAQREWDRIKGGSKWNTLSHAEKNHQLYLRQKELLAQFLKNGAISKVQYDKSLHDLTVKMGEQSEK